jgi:hypothetical protein
MALRLFIASLMLLLLSACAGRESRHEVPQVMSVQPSDIEPLPSQGKVLLFVRGDVQPRSQEATYQRLEFSFNAKAAE